VERGPERRQGEGRRTDGRLVQIFSIGDGAAMGIALDNLVLGTGLAIGTALGFVSQRGATSGAAGRLRWV
jgi:hypothetical protein